MKCAQLNCGSREGLVIPVIEIPTTRTKGLTDEMVMQRDSTYLIGEESFAYCQFHKHLFRLTDWITPRDWKDMQREVEKTGRKLEDQSAIRFTFMPVGWMPPNKYMEVERGKDIDRIN